MTKTTRRVADRAQPVPSSDYARLAWEAAFLADSYDEHERALLAQVRRQGGTITTGQSARLARLEGWLAQAERDTELFSRAALLEAYDA